jgi:hypothetical protein
MGRLLVVVESDMGVGPKNAAVAGRLRCRDEPHTVHEGNIPSPNKSRFQVVTTVLVV